MSGSFTGRETACCFSGHRSLTAAEMERASAEISALLPRLTDAGITRFYAGGALGFDLAASVTILNSRRLYPALRLTLALPCREHNKKWRPFDTALFERVAEMADEVVYVSEEYARGCMQRRNRYMVDRSSLCLCWMTERRGGTFYTVSYAQRQGLRVINLAPGCREGQICFDFGNTLPRRNFP